MTDLLRSALVFLLPFVLLALAGWVVAGLFVWQITTAQPTHGNCRTLPTGSWDCRPSNVKERPK